MASSSRGELASGLLWGFGSQGANQVVRLAITFILARQLEPRDFGLVASCLIVSETANRVARFGLLPALIQRAEIGPRDLSTAFWTSAAAGALLWVGVQAVAPAFGSFLNEPGAEQVLRWLALAFLPAALSTVPAALLTRALNFRALALSEGASVVIGGALGAGMALAGWGVEALVTLTVATQTSRFAIVAAAAGWLPRLEWDGNALKKLLSFGLASLGSEITGVVGTRLDLFLIARLVGMTPLGHYSLALRLVDSPRLRVTGIFSRVLLAVGSRQQEDLDRFRRTCRQVLMQQSLLLWPALFGLLAVAPEFVEVVLGETWLPAVPPLQIVCVTAAVRSGNSFCGTVLTATGLPHRQLLAGIIGVAALIPTVLLSAPFGITAVAGAILALSAGVLLLQAALLPRDQIAFRDLTGALRTPVLATAGMLGAVYALRVSIDPLVWPAAVRLLTLVACGVVIYTAAVAWLDPQQLTRILRLIRGVRATRETAPQAE